MFQATQRRDWARTHFDAIRTVTFVIGDGLDVAAVKPHAR